MERKTDDKPNFGSDFSIVRLFSNLLEASYRTKVWRAAQVASGRSRWAAGYGIGFERLCWR